MELLPAVMSGLVGVAVTTILHNMLPFVGLPRVNLAGLLGTWLLPPGSRAAILGLTLHFLLGALFSLLYTMLWATGVGEPAVEWGLLFGAVHGLIASMLIVVLLHRFPRPNEMQESPMTVVALFVLHVIFGLVVALQYSALV